VFGWEVLLVWVAAARQRRRDVRPRGHRGGTYPLLRAALCVVVRDLIVFGVLTDVMRGRPAVYATFSSYDEIAHHSGLERPDTLEGLRRLDERFERIRRMAAKAPRPYEIVVLSDHGQTQGATFLQRNGYGLEDLVRQSVATGRVASAERGDEQAVMVRHALDEASGRRPARRDRNDVSGHDVVVLGSGNLGLVYAPEPVRLTLEDLESRWPRLVSGLAGHPGIGFVAVQSREHGPVAIGADGYHRLRDGHVSGVDPLADFGEHAPGVLLRAVEMPKSPDIYVNSTVDTSTLEIAAFEDLVGAHGGLGGWQDRGTFVAPTALVEEGLQITGAEQLHQVLVSVLEHLGHRTDLPTGPVPTPEDPEQLSPSA
jgi:hypothetical protein